MISYLCHSILFQFRKERSVIVLLISGICIAVICVLSTLGNFGYSADGISKLKEYSTITFNPDMNTQKNAKQVIDYAGSLSRKGLYNAILVTPLGEGKYILGWLGYGYDFWMAPTSGRFFTEEEQEKGLNAAYISECILNTLEDPNYLPLDGETYQIVGSTFILNHDFYYVVPEESEVQLFYDGPEDQDIFNQYKFIILPYETYMRKYQPKQILIQYYDGNYRNMQRYEEKLRAMFPSSTVYKPERIADEEIDIFSQRHEILSYVFCLAILLTLVQLIGEWIKLYKDDFIIMNQVGLSKSRIICTICLQLFVYLITGTILAIILYSLLAPRIESLQIGNIYSVGTIIKVILALFILLYLCFSIQVFCEYRVRKGNQR